MLYYVMKCHVIHDNCISCITLSDAVASIKNTDRRHRHAMDSWPHTQDCVLDWGYCFWWCAIYSTNFDWHLSLFI